MFESMFNKNEFLHILVAIIVMAVIISLTKSWIFFALAIVYSIIVIFSNIIAKKLVAYHYEISIKTRIWQAQRYWLRDQDYLEKPIPVGILAPFFIYLLSVGYVKWLAIMQFDAMPLKHKAVKRHGAGSFSELNEMDIAIISTVGILANIVIAIIAYLLNLQDLAKLSIYFAIFNMIPLSQLDGTKVFFWSPIFWLFILAILFVCAVLFGI